MADEIIMQIDIHHLGLSEKAGDPHNPIVDRLIELLPKRGKRSYLAVFVLTHPDEDHCLGFKRLLANVDIGELWFSPRIFREYKKDFCEDALAFRKEAVRRVQKTIQSRGDVASGDKVRIIGYDDLLAEDEYSAFPKSCFSVFVVVV
jgi:glyoxylase-like metal-dependent hydrolase (beta-lactamase superfamily II)